MMEWLRWRIPSSGIVLKVTKSLRRPALKRAFMKGMTESGAQVFDCGIASTPAMFMSTVSDDNPTTGGVMITASHLPFNRNGLKFFTKEGGLDKKDITEILRIAEENEFPENGSQSEVSKLNLIDEYAGFLENTYEMAPIFKRILKCHFRD